MYKQMDAGERAGKLAELARLLGILEALADGPLLVEGAGGPTTADAALFPTLCFCRSVRTGARAVLQRREGCWRMLLWRSRCRVPVVCRPHARNALPPAPGWGTRCWLTHMLTAQGVHARLCHTGLPRPNRPPRMQILPTVFGWDDIFKSRPKLGAYFAAMQADEAGARVRARACAPSVARA